jgi:hypothetical protein
MTMPLPRTFPTSLAAWLLAAGPFADADAAGGSTPVAGTMASDTQRTAAGL